jgi:hypothetical protein
MDWGIFAFWCLLHLECFFCFLFRDCGPRGEEGVRKGVFIDGKWEMEKPCLLSLFRQADDIR